MNGWILIKNKKNIEGNLECFNDFEIKSNDIIIIRETDGRFYHDKVFESNERYMVILDGVLLNLSELKKKYKAISTYELIIKMYETNGSTYMHEFRGPFSGILYDRSKDIILSYANQTGDRSAYFFENENYLITASDFSYIIDFLKINKIQYEINPVAIKHMLTYGYMIDNTTFVNGISRILPGQVAIYKNGSIDIIFYYKLCNTNKIECSFDDAINMIDEEFRHAVKRCFDKDLEYGFEHHLADISAGFDSRMVNVVAKDMGYKNVTNISYSQWKSDENKYASLISKELQNNYIHMQLDDAAIIFDIDRIIKMNGGAGYYCAITGGERLLSNINFNKFGLEHTGQLGDVVIGSFNKTAELLPPDFNSKRNSNTLDLTFCEKNVNFHYENNELFNMYTRGFLGCLSSHFIRKNYTYAVSPFIDVDFLTLCFKLPLAYRINHRLYVEWIRRKYPHALNIPSSRVVWTGNIIDKKNFIITKGRRAISRGKSKILYKLRIGKSKVSINQMNPYDFWYDTNPNVRSFIKKYYEENKAFLQVDDDIKLLIDTMYKSEKALDKLIALTVIGVNKNFIVN